VALIAIRHPNRNGATPASGTPTVASSRSSSSSPAHSRSSSASPTTSSSTATLTGALPLKVLNDTSAPNLASEAADQFTGAGWTVTAVDENYSNNILSTAAYYDPTVANAKAVADALQRQFPTIKRVEPKFAPLVEGPVVVILTTDFSSA